MYGMKIGKYHSYKDFGLVPTSKPVVSLPQPRLDYLDIPGRQGSIDISESLGDEVIYEMRTGSFEFVVMDISKWQKVHDKLLSTIHGKKLNLILDSSPDFVYRGRVWVSEYKSDKNYSFITLEYKLEPYKYSTSDIKGNEIIHTLPTLGVTNGMEQTIVFDSDMTLVPEFNNKGSGIYLEHNGKSYYLKQGKNRFPEIRGRKNIKVKFKGSSKIDISYKRGWL